MPIVIGGSGSVGSTLLATVLNRHSEVFCGPELSLFNKEIVFADWRAARSLILARPQKFVTHGWGPYGGSSLYHDEFYWDRGELDHLLSKSENVSEFACRFFERPLSKEDKRVWIEKTPSNSLCFSEFLETFDDPRVVHMTRNPLDSVLSLVRRGFTPLYAAGIWVYNCAMALRSQRSVQYYELKYEELTGQPEEVLGALTEFLGISTDHQLLTTPQDSGPSRALESWELSPGDAIKPRGVRSFEQAPVHMRNEIRAALTSFRVSDKHRRRYDPPAASCEEACALLGYEFEPRPDKSFSRKFFAETMADALKRTVQGYKTGLGNYPGTLKW